MFRNLKFGYTVAMMPLLAAIGFILIIVQTLWIGRQNETHLNRIETGYVPALQLSMQLEKQLDEVQRKLQAAVAIQDEDMLQEVALVRDVVLKLLEASKLNPIRNVQDVEKFEATFQDYYQVAVKTSQQMMVAEDDESSALGAEELTAQIGAMTKKLNTVKEMLAKATENDRKEMKAAFMSAGETIQTSTRTAIIVTVIILTLLALLSAFILRGVTGALNEMTDMARSVAAGDLSRPVMNRNGENEIAQLSGSIDQMADALRDQVGAIKEAVSKLLQNSSEVTSATAQLSSAASEQASSIAETTSTIEEMKQSGQVAKQSASNIVESSEESMDVSQEGLGAVEESAAEIDRIREQSEEIATGIEGLRTQVSEVGEIISMVNQVAEQSNLLAVNASIEAAKAGESGLGFAVVAQEVKNLASQSKQATSQVGKTLNNIQTAIEGVFRMARAGRERAEAGVSSIKNTGAVIQRLGGVISTSAENAKRIAISSNEQVVGLEQVAQAMTSVNMAASENLNSTQQVEKGSDSLNSMARQLEELVARYELKDSA